MSYIKFLITTIILIWLSHYVAVFPHEYAHSIMAWLLGYKRHPFNIDYGGNSLANILLLSHIDENNNYFLINLLGGKHAIALIAFAGPGLGNGGMYLLSLYSLTRVQWVKVNGLLFRFVFWLNVMSLGNLYDYVPIRVFTTHGDVGHFLFALNNLSPWWVFVLITPIVFYLLYYFFSTTLLQAYQYCRVTNTKQRLTIKVLCILIFFVYFASPSISGHYGVISETISWCSIGFALIYIFIELRKFIIHKKKCIK